MLSFAAKFGQFLLTIFVNYLWRNDIALVLFGLHSWVSTAACYVSEKSGFELRLEQEISSSLHKCRSSLGLTHTGVSFPGVKWSES